MDFVLQILRVIVIYILIKRIVFILLGSLQRSLRAGNTHEKEVNELSTQNNVFIVLPNETVTAKCCEKVISKEKAFQVVTNDGTKHYFCSWDCRESFLRS